MKLYELRKLIHQLNESELGIVTTYVQRMLSARPVPAPIAERFGASYSQQMQEELEPLPHDWNTVVAFGNEE